MSRRDRRPVDDGAAGGTVDTDGGVSLFTGEPFVTVRSDAKAWQWTVEEARAFALVLLRTADYAEADADLVAVLRTAGIDDEAVVGHVVSDVRARRATRP